MDPLIRKIDCVRLFVSDLDAGLAFYRDGLGLSLVWRAEDGAGLRMPGTDAEIVLRTQPGAVEIDLLVDSADTAVESFRKAGGTIFMAHLTYGSAAPR